MFVADSEVELILLLNIVQSADDSNPCDREEAVGMFNVCVEPDDEKPNPPLFDVVANEEVVKLSVVVERFRVLPFHVRFRPAVILLDGVS